MARVDGKVIMLEGAMNIDKTSLAQPQELTVESRHPVHFHSLQRCGKSSVFNARGAHFPEPGLAVPPFDRRRLAQNLIGIHENPPRVQFIENPLKQLLFFGIFKVVDRQSGDHCVEGTRRQGGAVVGYRNVASVRMRRPRQHVFREVDQGDAAVRQPLENHPRQQPCTRAEVEHRTRLRRQKFDRRSIEKIETRNQLAPCRIVVGSGTVESGLEIQ